MPFNRKAREVRRESGRDEIIASASVDLRQADDIKYLRTVLSTSKSYGQLPWKWYDGIGEVHYAISRGSRVAGYAKLIAVELGKDGTPEKEAKGLPAEIADSIASPYGGKRGFVERFFTMSKIPGDCYLIECTDSRDGSFDGYDVLDADEIDASSFDEGTRADRGEQVFGAGMSIRRITHPMIGGTTGFGTSERLSIEIPGENFLGRIWRPSSRYVDLPDSPMRALEPTCELLYLLTMNLKAKILNRLALNGIVYIPTEVNDIRDGAPGGDQANPMLDGKVIDRLIRAASYAILNFDDPRSALPIFMSGPAQYADAIKHIILDRELYETDMKLRAELIDRLLMGLDIQPQTVRGIGDSNHWSSWSISDDERRINIQPDIETLCWAVTRMILHRKMLEAGLPPGRIRKTALWYDLTPANVKTNLAEDARQANDRILIGPAATRKLTGLAEADAPSEVEYIRMVGVKQNDPYLATFGMSEAEKIDWDKVGKGSKTGPGADSQGDKPKAGAGKSSGGPDDNESDTPRKLRPA